jgi:hypothetical protein
MKTALDASIGFVKTAVDGVATAIGALAASIWNQLLTLVVSITNFLEDVLLALIPLLTGVLNDYFTWLIGFYEDILNNLFFVIFDEIMAALGLTELITYMLDFFTDILALIGSIILFVGTVMGFVFAITIYWVEPARFEAVAMIVLLVMFAWVFYPLLMLFGVFANGNLSVDMMIDGLEQTFDKIFVVVKILWGFISYVFEFMLSLLTTIGGFIPLT